MGAITMNRTVYLVRKPTWAFVGATWAALLIATGTFAVCMWRMDMADVEIWLYLSLLLFGLFGVVSVTKAVRDREEGIPVTNIYHALSWLAVLLPMSAMCLYLLNVSTLTEVQRGMLFLTYMFAVFSAVVVQKNVRDLEAYRVQAAELAEPVRLAAGAAGTPDVCPEDGRDGGLVSAA